MNTFAIEKDLGIPGLFTRGLYDKYGAWWAGRKLLQVVWEKKPQVIRDTSFDLRSDDTPFHRASLNVLWRRPLEPYMIGWWVHLLDKNSQYLSACRGVKTGVGDPVHVAHGDDDTFIRPGLPGIYRVTWQRYELNEIFPPVIEPTQEWITNDVLEYALSRGYDILIHEAWVFPDYIKVFDKWAERLWNALQATKDTDRETYGKLKAISHVGPGSFATGKQRHAGIDLIHPNWWADIVSKARVNLLCNLETYGAPVCIRTDGLYYITRDPNIRTAVPGILDRVGQSGGYKIPDGWTSFQLTQELYDQVQGLDDGELSALFKKAAGMKNDAE